MLKSGDLTDGRLYMKRTYPTCTRHVNHIRVCALTGDVNPEVDIVQVFAGKGDLDSAPALGQVGAARLGHQLPAAVMDVHVAVATLHTLAHQPVQHGAAMVAPCGAVVAIGLKLVGARLLGQVG